MGDFTVFFRQRSPHAPCGDQRAIRESAKNHLPFEACRYIEFFYGDVAQMGERSVRNAEVVSSILIVSTNKIKDLWNAP